MKLSVIGGGGVRSMFLSKSLAQSAKRLGIDTLVFMDNDPEKLRIFGAMAKKIALLIDPSLTFICTTDAVAAMTDADYVITTIRVGGDDMRVRDERIALDLGLLGQETTGAAGFSFAMRSISALLGYCELAKLYAKKDVKVFNFTNPAGLVSQALRDAGYDFTFGICDAPSSMLHMIADYLNVAPERIKGEIYGLNHLSFFNSITLDGKEIIGELIDGDGAYQHTDMRYFDKELLRKKRVVPNEYLYYFYSREKAVANILNAAQTRGEQIAQINRLMISELSEVDIEKDFDNALAIFDKCYGMRENSYMASETGIRRDKEWHFDPFSEDFGGYASVALKYIEIAQSGKSDSMILCVPNNGALPILEDADVVEMTCDITKDGVYPHRFANVDDDALELIRRMKCYERMAATAILTKDMDLAVSALMLHPLVESYSLAKKLIDSYIELNKKYSDGWC
ncbi:MAG: 6-phospho-beta-glucosidase [Clostridia bacterium]|nr:6-phospho-beta-glucosidase [Clostridia bacterium]